MSHPDDRDPTPSPAEERTASSAPPPEHGDRYDHRTPEQRAEDAGQDTVDAPLQEGAAELRAATEAALQAGEVPQDPADPHPASHPPAG